MFADSMAGFLELNAYGKIDKDIFVNLFPQRSEIADAICVTELQAFSIKGRARNSVNFNCQIRVRNRFSSKAQKIALNIYNLLNKDGFMVDANGKRFTVRPMNPPMYLTTDTGGRANWVLNVTGLSLNY
nr:MAG TPA: hypothetical protein [Caudoviricetes sp.]